MKNIKDLYLRILIRNLKEELCKISYISILLFILLSLNVFGGKKKSANTNLNLNKEIYTVSNLHAEFRNGQIFLIWDEYIKNNQNLSVYILDKPINGRNLSEARLLTDQLEPHSANDWYDDPNECPNTGGVSVHGWIIESGHRPLDRNGGLFVHTVSKRDPHLAYLAVLGEKESNAMLTIGVNSLIKPISLSVGKIQAIWQLAEPQPYTKGLPLAISLHSHRGRPNGELTHLFFGDSSMGWREGLPFKFKITVRPDVVLMEPYDRVWINRRMTAEEAKPNYPPYDSLYKEIESWWFGTNNKINNASQISIGVPTNYTERWLLWAMKWVQQNYQTNPNKVYAFGASMGTGILRLVLRNPDRFASVDLLVPILDPFGEGTVGERMKARVGQPQSICSDGIKLSDRLNTIKLVKSSKTDIPPIVLRLGRSDKGVTWIRKPAFINTLQGLKQSIFVGWDNGTHSTAMRKPYEGFPDWYDFKWYINHFAINKSYPVFTECTLDDQLGNGDVNVGDTAGFINRGLNWKVISDTKSDYRILITLELPDVTYPVFVNITPRRRQHFTGNNKTIVYAYNINDKEMIIEKKILAINKSIFTYEKFAITSPAGNVLLVQKDK
jgi:hypothetical protein